MPQTAFPRVIRLSEPSPLSNLSPVALHGLNTRPAGNPTPLSVLECDTEPVYVSMHPHIQSLCVSNFSLSHASTVCVCRLYVCVCLLSATLKAVWISDWTLAEHDKAFVSQAQWYYG